MMITRYYTHYFSSFRLLYKVFNKLNPRGVNMNGLSNYLLSISIMILSNLLYWIAPIIPC